jgi:hypothetical protein
MARSSKSVSHLGTLEDGCADAQCGDEQAPAERGEIAHVPRSPARKRRRYGSRNWLQSRNGVQVGTGVWRGPDPSAVK